MDKSDKFTPKIERAKQIVGYNFNDQSPNRRKEIMRELADLSLSREEMIKLQKWSLGSITMEGIRNEEYFLTAKDMLLAHPQPDRKTIIEIACLPLTDRSLHELGVWSQVKDLYLEAMRKLKESEIPEHKIEGLSVSEKIALALANERAQGK